MRIVFFIKSGTVKIDKYNIKDIPGSSGRLDVISRSILSAVLKDNELDKNVEIWVFLDNYGTFIFDSNRFDDDMFPKNEILLSDYFVDFILKKNKPILLSENPLNIIKFAELDIFEALKNFIKKEFQIFVLNESGHDFFQYFCTLNDQSNLLFIIGDQSGELVNSQKLLDLNLMNISLGTQSYLASSVIRLIKLNLRLII